MRRIASAEAPQRGNLSQSSFPPAVVPTEKDSAAIRHAHSHREFLDVLADACQRLDASGVSYGLIGGVASSALGRPRTTRDIDVFVRPDDAAFALEVLGDAGYETDRLDDKWIYKATKGDTVVDIIFSTRYGIYLDREMSERIRTASFDGLSIRTIGVEDLIIMKAVSCDEASPRHWYDALGLVARSDLDWAYLYRRSLRAQRRVLSLLLYAQSIDYFIPEPIIKSMLGRITQGSAASKP
jgi:predicted nucleotidyltransferase